jgi:hypothetical protein
MPKPKINIHSQNQHRILIFSKDLSALKKARFILADEDFSLYTASTEEELISLCERYDFEYVFCDFSKSNKKNTLIDRMLHVLVNHNSQKKLTSINI